MAGLDIRGSRELLSEGANTESAVKLTLARLLLIGVFVSLTNFGFWQRIGLLLDNGRVNTLVPFLAIWGIAIAAIAVAALQPKFWVRAMWGAVIAVSTAVAWGYHHASQSELNVFDMLSLWNARHEAGRAAEFYGTQMMMASIVLVAGFLVIAVPPAPLRAAVRIWINRLAFLPFLPILLIGGVVYAKGGGGSQSLPVQFAPVALSSLAGAKIALQGTPVRKDVTWQPQTSARTPNIVMLVDESVRADYIDLTPGNPYTPNMAKLAGKFVNFGPAVSGGDCSNYSNSLLRFGASRKALVSSVNSNPTLWQYAKRAGFRTVFIDAQAGGITNPGLLQNFMTMQEKAGIDGFYAIRDVASEHADERLAEIVAQELKSDTPVFIYGNKNGAHFPYDHAYPASAAIYHPTMTESAFDTQAARIASYRNAIAWSVDRFMQGLFASADLSKTTLIYTSDHAQTLDPALLTHCQVEDPDPRMGLVPLMVYAADPVIRAGLERGAKLLHGKASHFQIAPALFALMGYARNDIAGAYDESLFDGSSRAPAFTSGDIFGLFASTVHWNTVDPDARYLEPQAFKPVTGAQG